MMELLVKDNCQCCRNVCETQVVVVVTILKQCNIILIIKEHYQFHTRIPPTLRPHSNGRYISPGVLVDRKEVSKE